MSKNSKSGSKLLSLLLIMVILSMLFSAFAPLEGLEGAGGQGQGGGQGNQSSDSSSAASSTESLDVRGSKQDPTDPCLDAGQLPCGQGDHGKGNPINGSMHANCRAAQGEVVSLVGQTSRWFRSRAHDVIDALRRTSGGTDGPCASSRARARRCRWGSRSGRRIPRAGPEAAFRAPAAWRHHTFGAQPLMAAERHVRVDARGDPQPPFRPTLKSVHKSGSTPLLKVEKATRG